MQAPAPEHLIKSGLPTEAMVASVLVAKYGWHLPLYRQAKMLACQGIDIDRSTLAFWVGYAAAELMPLYERLKAHLFASSPPCRRRDAGAGARSRARPDEDRLLLEHGARRPAVWRNRPARRRLSLMRRAEARCISTTLLKNYRGIVQCDGYAPYKTAAGGRDHARLLLGAFAARLLRDRRAQRRCAHRHRRRCCASPQLYASKKDHARHKCRTATCRAPGKIARRITDALKFFFEHQLTPRLRQSRPSPGSSATASAHWDGLTRFLDDGRIELDTNIVERSMRPQALTRKNALFAGHDDGAENWAILASLIETCKLNGIDPQAYLADVLVRLVNLWPNNRLDELLPWTWATRANSNAPPDDVWETSVPNVKRPTQGPQSTAYAQGRAAHHGADRQRGRWLPLHYREHRHHHRGRANDDADGGSFAEFERAMIRERTTAGLAAARAEGRIGGRRRNSIRKRNEIAESVISGRNLALKWPGSTVSAQPTISRSSLSISQTELSVRFCTNRVVTPGRAMS